MNDRGLSVLESYDLKVLRTYRGRGAIICETNQGLKILREFSGSVQKANIQNDLLIHMKEHEGIQVDCYVKNVEGGILSYDRDRGVYTLKDWFDGKECDVKSPEEIGKAVINLAKLHKVMNLSYGESTIGKAVPIRDEYKKHTKELKKVKQYIRNKSQKSNFEIYFLKCFEIFYEQAIQIQKLMDAWDDKSYLEKIENNGQLGHGDYNYHNIIMEKKGIATINFEKFSLDSGVKDLYQFMRKILEKNNWNQDRSMVMLDMYQKERELGKEEMKSLWLRLAYPEKFWKLSNYYYNSRKSWIPEKSSEKLRNLVEQEEAKRNLVEKLSSHI